MAKGVTIELERWNGEVGRCQNDHVVKIQNNGYGFCVDCSNQIDGYSTLYIVPKGFETPGAPISNAEIS